MITVVDYYKLVLALLVPNKRTPKTTQWNNALVSATYNEHILLFDYYKGGTIAPDWSASTVYQIGDVVKYGKSIFQNAVADNTVTPTFDDSWVVVTDNFIGTDERILFTGEKLTFEYALNKWFGTVFRQPPNTSDIYITTNPKTDTAFLIGNDEPECSLVQNNGSSELVVNAYSPDTAFKNMIIHVPSALFTSLGNSGENRKNVVRRFADKYVNAGIIYDVVSY